MDILGMVNKAADLIEEGTRIYESVKPSIDSLTGERPSGLDAAQERLALSLKRANAASANLDAALKSRGA
jgi:hypothetical protein